MCIIKILKRISEYNSIFEIVTPDEVLHLKVGTYQEKQSIDINKISYDELYKDIENFKLRYSDGIYDSKIFWEMVVAEMGIISKKYHDSLFCSELLVEAFNEIEQSFKEKEVKDDECNRESHTIITA